MEHGLIEGELEISYPSEGIGIDAYDFLCDKVFWLSEGSYDCAIVDGSEFVHPESVDAHGGSDGIGAGSDIEFVALFGRLVVVVPLVAIVQVVGFEVFSVAVIHRRECVSNFFVFGVPWNLGAHFPVECEVLFVEVFVFGLYCIVLHSRLDETRHSNGVAHPEYELFVLVVGDFRFVHPEGFNGLHSDVVRLFEDSRLCVRSHHECAFSDEDHTVGVCFSEVTCFTNADEFACRCAATRYHSGHCRYE